MDDASLYFRKGLSDRPSERASEALPRIARLRDDPKKYHASPGLARAANVALMLGKPLLLTGRPGTGKSQFAPALAHEMREDRTSDDPLPFHRFDTKSTSIARDLFYTYDAIAAFRDRTAEDARRFIEYQALGRAIVEAFPRSEVEPLVGDGPHRGPQRAVVLIDEIDKAPRDFPNDMLNEIDRLYFRVPELGNIGSPGANGAATEVPRAYRPIIVITSNSEKMLPEPFLRRCVFFHIDIPDRGTLDRIVADRLPDLLADAGPMVEGAVDFFCALRVRRPDASLSTAELLDWLEVLAQYADPAIPLRDQPGAIRDTLSALVKDERLAEEARRLIETPPGP